MKPIGYICLAAFVATALLSLFSLVETKFLLEHVGGFVRWHPEVADGITAPLSVGAVLAAVAAILSKAVGFGTVVIPRNRRGLVAAVRALSIPMRVVFVLSVAYSVAVFVMVEPARLRRDVASGGTMYYLYPQGHISEQAEIITRNEYRTYKAEWTRKITAVTMTVYLLSGCFLLSRYKRRDPELEKLAAQGLSSGQIDDSMNL